MYYILRGKNKTNEAHFLSAILREAARTRPPIYPSSGTGFAEWDADPIKKTPGWTKKPSVRDLGAKCVAKESISQIRRLGSGNRVERIKKPYRGSKLLFPGSKKGEAGAEPGGRDALAEAVAAGEGALVEPGVGVDGHRLPPEVRHPDGRHD